MTEITQELVDSVDRILDNQGLSVQVVRAILRDFGGQQIYVPVERAGFRAEDEAAIYDLYDGTNRRAVCRQYQISATNLYQILHREAGRRKQKNEKTTP